MKRRYLLLSLALAVVILLCACARTDANVEKAISEDGAPSDIEPVLPPPEERTASQPEQAAERPKPASVADVPIESVPMPDEMPIESEAEEQPLPGTIEAYMDSYRTNTGISYVIVDYLNYDLTGDGQDELIVVGYTVDGYEITHYNCIDLWNPATGYQISYMLFDVQYLRNTLRINDDGNAEILVYTGEAKNPLVWQEFGYSIETGNFFGRMGGVEDAIAYYAE